MNSSARYLAIRANFDFGYDWDVIGQSEDSLKTYTELLIKECIGLVEKDIEPELDGSDYAEHWNMALRSASNEIKQHFGVE